MALACESGTLPIFSCEAANGRKFIELSASSPVAEPDGFLEYRFGAQDEEGNGAGVELVYPPRREGSLQRFYAATYTKAGVYTQSVRFETGKARYEVFTEAKGMATVAAGVRVREPPRASSSRWRATSARASTSTNSRASSPATRKLRSVGPVSARLASGTDGSPS